MFEKALKIAWDNNWRRPGDEDDNFEDFIRYAFIEEGYGFVVLDPKFWECLGRGLGWEENDFELCFGCGVRITGKTPDYKTGKHYSCKSDIEWHPK